MPRIRLWCLLLVAVLVGGLVGCNGAQPGKNKDHDRPKPTGR